MPLEIVVHDLDQARGALSASHEAGVSVQLRSAPDAVAYVGVGYLHALGKVIDHDLVIDCGDAAGFAMEALRAGCQKILFTGKEENRQALVDMAAQLGADIRQHVSDSAHCLTLSPNDDGREATRIWLSSLPATNKLSEPM